jgi:flagellar biosynthesis protein FliQ
MNSQRNRSTISFASAGNSAAVMASELLVNLVIEVVQATTQIVSHINAFSKRRGVTSVT